MERSSTPSRPIALTDVKQWDLEADVVIVGLGGAGASAAIEAAKAGAEVLALEVASAGGGSTALSGGLIYLGGGTPTQRACGFEDSKEEMFKYLLRASGPNADEAKVRLYCEHSLEHYAWLLEQGIEFKPSFYPKKHTNTPNEDGLIYTGNEVAYPFDQIAKGAPRGHKPLIEGDHGGKPLMENLIKAAQAAGVRIQYDARGLTTVKDPNGRVVGVVARIDMREQYVKARCGVILTAGGFIMNPAMVRRHAPKLARCNYPNGNPNDDGTGIRMGMGAGGEAINMGDGFVSLPFYPPSDFVKGVIVNAQGQRFINEDSYHGRVGEFILQQPGAKAYLILDDELYERPLLPMGMAGVGDSFEELEAELGMPEKTLSHTLHFFNRYAAHGTDPLFHKRSSYLRPLTKPPFAALDASLDGGAVFPAMTFGGLNTLPTGEVLDADGQIVAGLYAAGRNSAGIPLCAEGYSSGMSVGDATFFGRLAGKSAAAAQPW